MVDPLVLFSLFVQDRNISKGFCCFAPFITTWFVSILIDRVPTSYSYTVIMHLVIYMSVLLVCDFLQDIAWYMAACQ
jgi:hypothetical protein